MGREGELAHDKGYLSFTIADGDPLQAGAAALLLAAGEQARRPAPPAFRGAVISRSGEVTWI